MSHSKPIHFKGLNGLRAIASLIVVIFHIDQFLRLFQLKQIGFSKDGMAGYAVILFFVLSGFLITYLLLKEKEQFSKIDLPKFYLRRILRIWPIYYLLIIIALVSSSLLPALIGIPKPDSWAFILYSLLLANVGFGLGFTFLPITPLWSVAVEEQFYLFWPLLVKQSKNILVAFASVAILYFSIKCLLRFFENGTWYLLVSSSSFDSMAIGGIGGYLVFTKNKYLSIIYSPILQIAAWVFLLASILYKPVHIFGLIDNEIHSIFYLILIVNVSTNPKTLITLENRLFNFIGKISYGIYVYHMTVIICLSLIFKYALRYNPDGGVLDYMIVFVSILLGTVLISFLSYKYFEAYFLKMKGKFSKVESAV